MIVVNSLTGQYLIINHPGHADQSVHGKKGSGLPSGRQASSMFKRATKLASKEYYEDPDKPAGAPLKKTKVKKVGISKLTRDKLLRLAGDEYGIETDDMEPYDVDTEDTEAVRKYVKDYAKDYAGHKLED